MAQNHKNDIISEQIKLILEKGRLLLTVEVKTEKDVEQLIAWMYAKQDDKPMTAELHELAWDKESVTKKDANLIKLMRETLLES